MTNERYPHRGFRDAGPEEAKAAKWAQVGRELGKIFRSSPWAVADWWVDGDDLPRGVRLGIVQALDWTGPPYESCNSGAAWRGGFRLGVGTYTIAISPITRKPPGCHTNCGTHCWSRQSATTGSSIGCGSKFVGCVSVSHWSAAIMFSTLERH